MNDNDPIDLTLARLKGYAWGLGLDEATTRQIVEDVLAKGDRPPDERRAEVRRRMLEVAGKAEMFADDAQAVSVSDPRH